MHFLMWLLIHSVYRLKKEGLHNISGKGPAILVCNHVSFVGAIVIAAGCPRPIRFVMDYNIFKVPVLNFVFRTANTIPNKGRVCFPDTHATTIGTHIHE